MAQRISNLYRLVTLPRFYAGLQTLLGASRGRRRFVDEVIQARTGMSVLDVGCGPASLLPYLPDVDYTGVDLNANSIAYAQAQYGSDRVRFIVGDAAKLGSFSTDFDLIIVSALLHHLGDNEAIHLFGRLARLLKPGGRIVTIDNVWLPRQNPIAKLTNALDSGMNVRTPEQYVTLVSPLSLRVEQRIFRDLLRIPYDHFCMILTAGTPSQKGQASHG